MKYTVMELILNYKKTKEEYWFEQLLNRFLPLVKSYARKIYYLEYEDSCQELSIALYETIVNMKCVKEEYACISYIKKSLYHKFTKLYKESQQEQQIQFNSVEIMEKCDSDSHVEFSDQVVSNIDLTEYLKNKKPIELKIIKMIMKWYSDEEIGKIMGYSRQYINRFKKKIMQRKE